LTPLLLTLGVFGFWWLIGVATLQLLGRDLRDTAAAVSAPIVGSAVTVIPLFLASYAGVSMHAAAPPILAILTVAAAAVVGWRRPRIARSALFVVVVCLVEAIGVGSPFFSFGFHWFANANDDMANYVLSATHLVGHGLLGPVDYLSLAHDRGFSTSLQQLHNAGSRPGADITLAALASVSGRPPRDLFMVLILAFQLLCICGAATLAMSATRRVAAAVIAAVILAIAPLATYGMLQQLLPQVWGLALAALLFALLMRRELYKAPGASPHDVVLVGLVAAAIIVVYVELASTVFAAYALFVVLLLVRGEFQVRAAARLWIPAVVMVGVLLNAYLWRELTYVQNQANSGFSGSGGGRGPDIFGYALVPGSLTGLTGLQILRPDPGAPHFGYSLAVALALTAAVIAGCLWASRRVVAPAVVVSAYAVFGVLLATQGSDFGEFKLFMYVQPFIAAAVAVWLSGLGRRALIVVGMPLLALAAAQLSTQRAYVSGSRNPVDLPHASAADLVPAFTRAYQLSTRPVVSVTDNPVLAKLEGASVGDRPLYLVSSNIFGALLSVATERYDKQQTRRPGNAPVSGWRTRVFRAGHFTNPFEENVRASKLITSGTCDLVLPSGSQLVLNRRRYPEGTADLVFGSCPGPRNFLVFQNSTHGASFYSAFKVRKDVTFYQPERDVAFGHATFSGTGRYLLFRVLNPTKKVRIVLTLTETPLVNHALPRAVVYGATRVAFRIEGEGSARVVSEPLRPKVIGGVAYVLLDLGRDGRLRHPKRTGLQGLYGRSYVLDPRYLTSYIRDVSAVTNRAAATMPSPTALASPADLRNPNFRYSGISEDGWVAKASYVVLAPGAATRLEFEADVLDVPHQALVVVVDGEPVYRRAVGGGHLSIGLPLPASEKARVVELKWSAARRVGVADSRILSARIERLALRRP
jgi:hypothetical protein